MDTLKYLAEITKTIGFPEAVALFLIIFLTLAFDKSLKKLIEGDKEILDKLTVIETKVSSSLEKIANYNRLQIDILKLLAKGKGIEVIHNDRFR